MAVGGPGGDELDGSTVALRQLMSRAGEDDSARLETLALIARRLVVVATWPHSPESVRTLTNSDGEQAMPVFSGLDVLLDAAQRFGWTSPDGSVSHRELAGGEALRGAMTNGVHFVVLDICTDCTVEFGRNEVEQALQTLPQTPPVRASRTPSVRGLSRPPRRVSMRPHEGTTPLLKVQPVVLSSAIVEENVVPRGRAARPDPRAEPSQAKTLAMVAVARVPQALLQARQALAPSPAAALPARPPPNPTPDAAEDEPQTLERPVDTPSATAADDAFPPPLPSASQVSAPAAFDSSGAVRARQGAVV